MRIKKITLSIFLGLLLFASSAPAKELKGVVIGEITAKGQRWVELRKDSHTIDHYIVWGSLPEDGRDLDESVMAQIREIHLNSRVELSWEFRKYLRVTGIKFLSR